MTKSATEKPVVFTNEGMQLVGMLHRPVNAPHPPAVVFYHGCMGTKTEAHWLFVKLARALADAGCAVLRFDFRHSGDSEGSFEQMTLAGEIADGIRALDAVVELADADPGRIGILGLSMGGTVAASVAGRMGELVRSCVLLNPIAHPLDDIQAVARMRNVTVSSFPVDYYGFLFGAAFAGGLSSIDPLGDVARAVCPILVLSGSEDATVPPSVSKRFVDALRDAGRSVESAVIEGADHTFSSTVWEREVTQKVTAWFRTTLLPSSS